jgi:hypothetical protein
MPVSHSSVTHTPSLGITSQSPFVRQYAPTVPSEHAPSMMELPHSLTQVALQPSP